MWNRQKVLKNKIIECAIDGLEYSPSLAHVVYCLTLCENLMFVDTNCNRLHSRWFAGKAITQNYYQSGCVLTSAAGAFLRYLTKKWIPIKHATLSFSVLTQKHMLRVKLMYQSLCDELLLLFDDCKSATHGIAEQVLTKHYMSFNHSKSYSSYADRLKCWNKNTETENKVDTLLVDSENMLSAWL